MQDPDARSLMVQEAHEQHARPPRRRVRHAGLLMGVGTALFLEGTLVRQVLGWHALVEPDPDPVAEGLLQLGALALVLGGVALLHRARSRLMEPASGRVLTGSALVGAGLTLLVEGALAHAVLGLHHVRSGAPAWDAVPLAIGLLLALGGWRLMVLAARVQATGSPRRPTGRAGRRAL